MLNMLNNENKDRVNLLRFHQILSELFNECRDIVMPSEI